MAVVFIFIVFNEQVMGVLIFLFLFYIYIYIYIYIIGLSYT